MKRWHRSAVAALLVLTVAFTALAAAGFVTYQQRVPEKFGVPAFAPEDNGAIHVSYRDVEVAGGSVEDQDSMLRFALHPAAPVKDGLGRTRDAGVLQVAAMPDGANAYDAVAGEDGSRFYFDAAGFVAAAIRQGHASTPGTVATDTARPAEVDQLRFDGALHMPCGYLNTLQGRTIDVADGVTAWGDCAFEEHVAYGIVPVSAPTRFHVVDAYSTEGARVLVLESVSDAATTRLWLRDDVPIPVRIEQEFHGDLYEGTITHAVVALERGAGAYDLDGDLPAAGLPVLTSGPVDRYGPRAAEAPYPIATAIEEARTAEGAGPRIDAFLTQNPDWIVAAAQPIWEQSDDQEHEGWTLTLAAENGMMAFTVLHHRYVLASPLGAVEETWNDDLLVQETDTGFLPAKPPMPTRLPEAQGVKAQWAAYEGRDVGEARVYGFRLTCSDATCTQTRAEVFAGDQAPPADRNQGVLAILPPQERQEPTYSHWYVGGEGEAVMMETAEGRWRGTGPAGALSSDARGYDKMRFDPASFAGLSLWRAPEPEVTTGISLAAVMAGILFWAWPALKTTPFFGLFTRLRPDAMLEHPVRAQIFDRIEHQPGIHLQQIVRAVGKGNGVVEHHLRKLVDGGLVAQATNKGFTCYFPKGAIDHRIMLAAPVLKSPGARAVLAAVHGAPGLTVSEVAAKADLSPATAHYHIKRLRECGLLDTKRDGRIVKVVPLALAKDALRLAAAS